MNKIWERFVELFADDMRDVDAAHLWLVTRRYAWDTSGRSATMLASFVARAMDRVGYTISIHAMQDMVLTSPDGDPYPTAVRALRELRAAEVDQPLMVVMDALESTHTPLGSRVIGFVDACIARMVHALSGGHSLRNIDAPSEVK